MRHWMQEETRPWRRLESFQDELQGMEDVLGDPGRASDNVSGHPTGAGEPVLQQAQSPLDSDSLASARDGKGMGASCPTRDNQLPTSPPAKMMPRAPREQRNASPHQRPASPPVGPCT